MEFMNRVGVGTLVQQMDSKVNNWTKVQAPAIRTV